MTGYVIERLGAHDRRAFASGEIELDRYFRERISQDVRRKVATAFVAVSSDGEVAGFYTLTATSVPLALLPQEAAKRLPGYPLVPAILLGRLAVAIEHKGRRLGRTLLADAFIRAGAADVGAHLLIVDALNDSAARFYAERGFERLADAPMRFMRRL